MFRPSGKESPGPKSVSLKSDGNPCRFYGQKTMDHLLSFGFDMTSRRDQRDGHSYHNFGAKVPQLPPAIMCAEQNF
jgi:hypothetical protein